MKTAPIAALKASLSQYLDAVRRGEEVVVTDRGRPVARILPVEGPQGSDARAARLVREGLLSPRRKRPSGALKPPSGRRRATGVLAALLEERGEGR